MPRERLKLGEWGRISTVTAGGQCIARVRVRDQDGKQRQISASGRSASEARQRLQEKITNREAPSTGTRVELSKTSSLAELFAYWISQKSKDVAPQTVSGYSQAWRAYCGNPIGQVLICEITPGKIDTLIHSIADRTTSGARTSRIVLSGMLGLAVRFDLLAYNLVRETPRPSTKKKPVRALTLDEFGELRERIRTYCRHVTVDENGLDRPKLGQKPGSDLEDILLLLIATGARISEVLALTWHDVDLDSVVPRATIAATLIVPRAAGERLFRQSHRKGESPPLVVVLPQFAVEALIRRREAPTLINPSSAIFVTSTGNWVSPANVRRSWRAARGADFEWVKPHSMRKTVATLVKESYGVEAAQVQLGHANSRVTEAHYIQRINIAPDLTDVLNTFAPKR